MRNQITQSNGQRGIINLLDESTYVIILGGFITKSRALPVDMEEIQRDLIPGNYNIHTIKLRDGNYRLFFDPNKVNLTGN